MQQVDAAPASSIDWGFIDAVYVITCPNADQGGRRLEQTNNIIDQLQMRASTEVQIKEFDTDDEDRVRGCYTSHLSVLKDASKAFRRKSDYRILVLEDNLAVSAPNSSGLQTCMLREWNRFMDRNPVDILHLAYTPYVPNLTVCRTDSSDGMVQLKCGVGSALGTSAYVITERGVDALLAEDSVRGYTGEAIPDVMAKLFPDTRYAAYPAPFQRAAKTKSLVNPQLDDLRAILFQPVVVSKAQDLLVLTGLCTNQLLPAVVIVLLAISGLAGKITVDAGLELITTGAYRGNILLPLVSSVFSLFSLGVLAVGAALAPKTEAEPSEEEDELDKVPQI